MGKVSKVKSHKIKLALNTHRLLFTVHRLPFTEFENP